MHHTKLVPQKAICVTLLSLTLGILSVRAQEGEAPRMPVVDDTPSSGEIVITLGGYKLVQMKGDKPIKRAEPLGREGIVQITPLPDDDPRAGARSAVIVTGRQIGIAPILLTADDGTKERYDILVQPDTEYLANMLRRAVPTANLQFIPGGNGSIVISGHVMHAEDIDVIMRLAESELGLNRVINNMKVAGVQQVQLDVVVARVSRSELRQMAFDFINQGSNHGLVNILGGAGGAAALTNTATSTVGSPFAGTITSTAAATGAPGFNIAVGVFNTNQSLFTLLRLLRTENVSKIVAEPKLVTLSGRPATFHDGGQQAIPQPGGLGAVAVNFQPFGTDLTFLPIVLGNGKIHLDVFPSISTLTQEGSTVIAGTAVQGRSDQFVRTSVVMEPGQTFVVGGLVQHQSVGVTSKVPVLGDLPLFGALFATKSFEEREFETVILVTPHLVDPMDCHQAPKMLPGDETRTPDDFELFLEGIMEAPRGPRQVFKNRRYVPAYKNSPSAATFPCAGNDCCGGRGCSMCGRGCGQAQRPMNTNCDCQGLASQPAIEYSSKKVATDGKAVVTESKPSLEVKHGAALLPIVEVTESASPQVEAASEGSGGE